MPHGARSLPIPDFVCQSFQQQAAGPVRQHAEAEGGQPAAASSPLALKRKPGRKPRKVRLCAGWTCGRGAPGYAPGTSRADTKHTAARRLCPSMQMTTYV